MKHYLRFMITLILTTVWCMGGYAQETVSKLWDLTKSDDAWVATNNATYFSQPYGFKKVNGTLTNKSIADFSKEGITQIKVGFKCLQNGGTNSKITIYLVDSNGNVLGDGQEVTPINKSSASNTTYQYATFTSNLVGAKGFMMKVTKLDKNILVNGASYEVTYTPVSTKTLTTLAISGTPTKTTYNVGDEFDPAGLTVTGTYDDSSTKTITDGITWTTTPAKLSAGTTSCSVTATVDGVTSPAYEVTGLKVTNNISLSIDPATSTVVKAPVNVTLTATEGAAVYYTTDGSEPTTSSTKYDTPFEVTTSGTTVKAIAVADGAENATAEATYTIQPDQPVFSDTSKTFKDAFDVILSLPTTTDETSKIYYAINGTATAESTEYTKPVNISAENDGDKVILHAVVVDKYGNVGKEKYCTYTKSTNIVFDFTANPNVWGIIPLANNGKTGDNVIAGKELEVGDVVMTATNGSSYGTCLYMGGKDNTVNLRVYNGGSVTFTAPEGYNISEIALDGDSFLKDKAEYFTANEKDLNISSASSATWTGNSHEITFTCSKSIQVNTATVKLVVVETPEATSGTLDFKAVDDGIYYATFSSDKNVVFPKANVDVYSYSVSNGMGTQSQLTNYYYEVTDAAAGEKGIVEGYYVPANTGVLIESLEKTTPYYFPKTAETPTLPANQLKPAPVNGGVLAAEDGHKYYKLAYDDFDAKTGLGFYWGADNGGAFKVKAGTAYLAVPTSDANARCFTFDGGTTGINEVTTNDSKVKNIYNLNGQRVENMSHAGLYIVNGKKVVIRK